MIIATTRYSALAPSSGSQYFVLAEVTKYENIKIAYSSMSVGLIKLYFIHYRL